MERVFILIVGYLLGSFQTAIILGRFKGLDIRHHGSGNAGATNTLRVLGIKSAITVFFGDMLKAVIAILVANFIFKNSLNQNYLLITIYAGLGAILGHNWPVYFGFKGGKGIAVSIATLGMIDYQLAIVGALIAIAIISFTRYVSLGSMVFTLAVPLMILIFRRGRPDFLEVILLVSMIPLLAIFQHRANIGRLLRGTESKLGQKAK